MDIRNPRADETVKIYDLWQVCFNDPKPFADYLFSKLYKPYNTICVFEGEELLSALQIYYYDAVFKGKPLKAAYIAGVSTYPNQRNKGYSKILMNEAEKRLCGEKIDIITLIPFKFSFYEKFGYRTMSYLFYYNVKSDINKKYNGSSIGERKSTELYSNFVKQFDFTFERNEILFSEILEDVKIGGGELYSTDGGYMYIYPSEKKIYVPEIIYENEETLLFMLSYLNNIGKDFTIRSGVNLLPYLSETDIKIELKPHLMIKELTEVQIKASFKNYINMLGWV